MWFVLRPGEWDVEQKVLEYVLTCSKEMIPWAHDGLRSTETMLQAYGPMHFLETTKCNSLHKKRFYQHNPQGYYLNCLYVFCSVKA